MKTTHYTCNKQEHCVFEQCWKLKINNKGFKTKLYIMAEIIPLPDFVVSLLMF